MAVALLTRMPRVSRGPPSEKRAQSGLGRGQNTEAVHAELTYAWLSRGSRRLGLWGPAPRHAHNVREPVAVEARARTDEGADRVDH